NCTLVGNSTARNRGGGAAFCTLNNCILYYNSATSEPNYFTSTLNFCCTSPDPGGTNNITAEPQLAGLSHLSAGSPCRGAGSSVYAAGLDMDGESWLTPPSIGCDEYRAGAVTGPLNVAIRPSSTEVAAGFPVELTSLIEGRVTACVWDFGNGM